MQHSNTVPLHLDTPVVHEGLLPPLQHFLFPLASQYAALGLEQIEISPLDEDEDVELVQIILFIQEIPSKQHSKSPLQVGVRLGSVHPGIQPLVHIS